MIELLKLGLECLAGFGIGEALHGVLFSEVALELARNVFNVVMGEVWDAVERSGSIEAGNGSHSRDREGSSHAKPKNPDLLAVLSLQKLLGSGDIGYGSFPVKFAHEVSCFLTVFGALAAIDVRNDHLVALIGEAVGSDA